MAQTLHVDRNPWCRPRHQYPPGKGCCLEIDKPPRRPDLAIYSQEEQIAAGAAPTWDSPDILTNHRRPWALLPEQSVTVRNLSPEAGAVNARVHCYTAPFGIGTPRAHLSSKILNLGPGASATLLYPLTQALLAGDPRIRLEVVIELPADARAINNRGFQAAYGAYTGDAGRTLEYSFPVVNDAPAPRQITLAALGNELSAAVTPLTKLCAPWEQYVATVRLSVPAALHGAPGSEILKPATIVAWANGSQLVGGLTYLIWVND